MQVPLTLYSLFSCMYKSLLWFLSTASSDYLKIDHTCPTILCKKFMTDTWSLQVSTGRIEQDLFYLYLLLLQAVMLLHIQCSEWACVSLIFASYSQSHPRTNFPLIYLISQDIRTFLFCFQLFWALSSVLSDGLVWHTWGSDNQMFVAH